MFKKNYFQKLLLQSSKKRFSSGFDYDLAVIGGGPGGIYTVIKDTSLPLKLLKKD